MNNDKKNLFERLSAPTPKFFKRLRNIGLTLAAISGAIMTAPVSLPAGIVTLAGYLLTASGVLAAVSQLPVDENTDTTNDIKR